MVWSGSHPLRFAHSHTIPLEIAMVSLVLIYYVLLPFLLRVMQCVTGDGDRASILAHLLAVRCLSRELSVVCALICVCSLDFLYTHNQIFTAVLST